MSFDMNKTVKVTNRSGGRVIYRIPEHNIRREFEANETKILPYQELVWLSYRPGGRTLMANMLLIQENKVIEELNIHAEPEYFLDEAGVIKLLLEGSVDELKDALDFAPKGVIQIIKDQAVALPLYDMRKREAIFQITGFDVTAAIENNAPDADDVQEEVVTPTRRVQPKQEGPVRRTESKYKVISSGEE